MAARPRYSVSSNGPHAVPRHSVHSGRDEKTLSHQYLVNCPAPHSTLNKPNTSTIHSSSHARNPVSGIERDTSRESRRSHSPCTFPLPTVIRWCCPQQDLALFP